MKVANRGQRRDLGVGAAKVSYRGPLPSNGTDPYVTASQNALPMGEVRALPGKPGVSSIR